MNALGDGKHKVTGYLKEQKSCELQMRTLELSFS